jgi:hypothetical protein
VQCAVTKVISAFFVRIHPLGLLSASGIWKAEIRIIPIAAQKDRHAVAVHVDAVEHQAMQNVKPL